METNEDIDLIVNHPKKAINNLAVPIFLTNLFLLMNNFTSGIWVAGLGADALTAVGFISPIFLIILGFANGLGAGSNSIISRHIGAKKYDAAGNSAIHSIMLSIIFSIITTIILSLVLKPLLYTMGAGEVINDAFTYGYIMILGCFSIFIPAMMTAIFRSEGKIKRATYPLMLVSFINMILDPIFIYVLNLGVAGAAIATIISALMAMCQMIYWMFIKRDGFLKIRMHDYKRDFNIYKDILVVGIPASLEQFFQSFESIITNYWLTILSGPIAVASYTATWRLLSVGISPLLGIGIAALTVGGAAYGAKNYNNMKTTKNYALKLGLISSIIIVIIFFTFAEPLSHIFAYSSNNPYLVQRIAEVIRIQSFFILVMPMGVVAGNLFQSMGKGTITLFCTIIRAAILEIIFAGLFGFVFGLKDVGIYGGIVFGMTLGSILSYVFLNFYLEKQREYFN